MNTTAEYYDKISHMCYEIFEDKIDDYGTSWRVLRLPSLTDQIYIKAQRIRTLQTVKKAKINDSIESEFMGIINYSLIALIQLDLGVSNTPDIDKATAVEFFLKKVAIAKKLMLDKNHDYGEAWKNIRIESITDIMLQKILRLRQIEDLKGKTKISEGVDANYMDIANYAIFCLIKLLFTKNEK